MSATLVLLAAICSSAPSLYLVPAPQRVRIESGVWTLSEPASLDFSGAPSRDRRFLSDQLTKEIRDDFPGRTLIAGRKNRHITVGVAGDRRIDDALSRIGVAVPQSAHPGAYVLAVRPDEILVAGRDSEGAFYGVQTLKQLFRANADHDEIACCTIEDWPAMRIRGWQDDISRGPIPTMDTLKREIRTMAEFKMNAFTLYTEHVFKLKKHPTIAPPDGLTAKEVRELVEYAKPYHVEVIGNFQSFGHFYNILKVPGYERLGENSWVISPAKEEAYAFLKDVYDEIAPAYASPLFNINCDEVGGLGEGASKDLVAKIGVSGVYARHINRIADLLRAHGKTPMMWGDIALQHRDIVPQLPKDLVVLSWAYHAAERWDDAIKPFADLGFRFLVCPGVSCWGQIFPDLDNAEVNISNYVRDGARYNALGMLNTTWDDTGENLWNFNWLPLAWSADCAWKPALGREGQDWNEAREERYASFARSFGLTFYGPSGPGIVDGQMQLSRLRKNPVTRGMSDSAFWVDLPTLAAQPVDPVQATRALAIVREILRRGPAQSAGLRFNRDTVEFIDFAARRAEFAAWRVLTVQAVQSADTADDKKIALAAIGRLVDRATALRASYIQLWNAENRPWWRDQITARYDRLIAELQNASTAPLFWPASDAIGEGIDVRIETLGGAPVRYTLDGSEPSETSALYAAPIHLTRTTRVRARAFPDGKASSTIVERTFHALTRPASITTSMSAYGDNKPERAFDGDDSTFFWSEGDPGPGAHFTVTLTSPEALDSIRVVTGHRDHPEDYAHNAVLEVSSDGQAWEKAADFTKGVAEANLAGRTVKGVRIRTLGPNGYWLVVREIQILAHRPNR